MNEEFAGVQQKTITSKMMEAEVDLLSRRQFIQIFRNTKETEKLCVYLSEYICQHFERGNAIGLQVMINI